MVRNHALIIGDPIMEAAPADVRLRRLYEVCVASPKDSGRVFILANACSVQPRKDDAPEQWMRLR